MISKLITYGKDRDESIARMLRAISEYHVVGVQTTLPFGAFVMEHPAFVSGNFDTHFVKKYYAPEKLQKVHESEARTAAIIALKKYFEDQKTLRLPLN